MGKVEDADGFRVGKVEGPVDPRWEKCWKIPLIQGGIGAGGSHGSGLGKVEDPIGLEWEEWRILMNSEWEKSRIQLIWGGKSAGGSHRSRVELMLEDPVDLGVGKVEGPVDLGWEKCWKIPLIQGGIGAGGSHGSGLGKVEDPIGLEWEEWRILMNSEWEKSRIQLIWGGKSAGGSHRSRVEVMLEDPVDLG
ncbi:hypothetical protein HGM15179_019079 [Zosterops borbonicus]|uniref:Uncharacterized protein n=1 Tax=Zosterops borbonicus TaxID=364589 RepID=A0A8K1DBX8_9PASS|nr:hypothetical protein HGM15179_019079 [Zosterops borbonicus]